MDVLLTAFDTLEGILQSFHKTKSPLGNDMTEDMKKQIKDLSAYVILSLLSLLYCS